MARLGKGVAPEDCAGNGALGFHPGFWYFLLYQKGGPKPPDDATHVFQCHYCEFEERGRPNDGVGDPTRTRQAP